MKRMLEVYESTRKSVQYGSIPRVKVFNRWVKQLLLMPVTDTKMYTACCFLMVLLRHTVYNSRYLRAFLKGRLHTIKNVDTDFVSDDFFKLMKTLYRLLDQDIVKEILALPVNHHRGFLKKEFHLIKNYKILVYFDAFGRIIHVSLNTEDISEDEFYYIYKTDFYHRNNWRGKSYYYTFINPTSPVWSRKLRQKFRLETERLRKEIEHTSNSSEISNAQEISEDFDTQEYDKFNNRLTWPPIDYDCAAGWCLCNEMHNKDTLISIENCRITQNNFMDFVHHLSKLNGRTNKHYSLQTLN